MGGAFASGVVAGYGIAVPVGAIAILIVLESAQFAFRQGFVAGLGAASADLVYATIAAAAGTGLDSELRAIRSPLHAVGGCVLAAIALRGFMRAKRAPSTSDQSPTRDLAKTYKRFLALTLINPLTIIYFASVVFGNATAATPPSAIAFIAGVALASASWQTLLAASGALLGRTAIEKARVATAILGYGIILALAIHQVLLA
jgi:threonine/homoserine/homoserine lactone efflux protein